MLLRIGRSFVVKVLPIMMSRKPWRLLEVISMLRMGLLRYCKEGGFSGALAGEDNKSEEM